jgi:predicted lipid-binding transport protein (Tim44 family)
MKRWFVALSVALCSVALLPSMADAKRLGGGGISGMKRDIPARTAPDAVPAKPGAPTQAAPAPANAGAAAAAAPKRSWMGPIAGLAAGLGLAALMSHLGLGAELANFVMIALLALVAFIVIRLLMRRFAGAPARPALATPNGMQFAGSSSGSTGSAAPVQPANLAPAASAAAVATATATAARPSALPADFDTAAFERIAKMIFIRMQAANDAGDLNDLRAFTTPELFASIRLELQERQGAAQQTDVVQIDTEVLDFAQEPERQIVSVRFHGLIREARDSGAEPFDEVWHLVKPADGSREWAIAGIQPAA